MAVACGGRTREALDIYIMSISKIAHTDISLDWLQLKWIGTIDG